MDVLVKIIKNLLWAIASIVFVVVLEVYPLILVLLALIVTAVIGLKGK